MSINNPTFRKISFEQLIREIKVEIPIIQRDYAQGRSDKTEIRSNFLQDLQNAINAEAIELDFVYGSKSKNNNCLHPLDGQQRLTTLFLIHWYIANKENQLSQEIKEVLKKFTYETRTSSRYFCTELVESGIDFNNLLDADAKKNNQFSKSIINTSWFFLSWEKDPTIKAMLIMLDAIHEKFKNSNFIWEKLINERKITFQYIELTDFGLSDDLYIKMNARGKALTSFENFKARLEKWIEEKGWEKDLEIEQKFSHKIDTIWTDLFWKQDDKKRIDDAFIKFIAGTAINFYAQDQDIYESVEQDTLVRKELEGKAKNKSVTTEAIKRERIERRIVELFNDPNKIKPNDFFKKESIEFLRQAFDVYSKNDNDRLSIETLKMWAYSSVNYTLFTNFIKKTEEITYNQRVLYYAQTEFISSVKAFNKEIYLDWMRVIRNIIKNATIDSASTFIGAINLVKELSNGSSNIYEYLSTAKVFSNFAAPQIREEILKAQIILSSKDNKQVIFDTEDTNFCEGKIEFALFCIDCQNASQFDADKLFKIKNVIHSHLSERDITNEFRRALLTIDNNDFYNYWTSWSYGTNSHKRCLIENTSELKNAFNRKYLKELLKSLTIISLNDIIKNYVYPNEMDNWKKRLIKESELLDEYCQSHYIGITNESCLLFKNKKRPNNKEECYEVK